MHFLVQQQLAQFFAKRGTARLTGTDNCLAPIMQQLSDKSDVRRFAGAIDAFKCNELATCHKCIFQPAIILRMRSLIQRWYLLTARLWSLRSVENWLVPSPRETKYKASVFAGFNAAASDASPGSAIGVDGRPART